MGKAGNWCAENGSNPRADSDRNSLRSGPARSGPLPARSSSLSAPAHTPPPQGDWSSGGRPSHVLAPIRGTVYHLGLNRGSVQRSALPPRPRGREDRPGGQGREGGQTHSPPASRARLIGSSQRVFLILETVALCDHRTAPDGPRAQIDPKSTISKRCTEVQSTYRPIILLTRCQDCAEIETQSINAHHEPTTHPTGGHHGQQEHAQD